MWQRSVKLQPLALKGYICWGHVLRCDVIASLNYLFAELPANKMNFKHLHHSCHIIYNPRNCVKYERFLKTHQSIFWWDLFQNVISTCKFLQYHQPETLDFSSSSPSHVLNTSISEGGTRLCFHSCLSVTRFFITVFHQSFWIFFYDCRWSAMDSNASFWWRSESGSASENHVSDSSPLIVRAKNDV